MTSLLPPGEPERVDAASALVLAPHYDDEVLGCGGLVARLAASGAEVGVLFLTDGTASTDEGEDPLQHAAQRRREAEAAGAVLGIRWSEHLGLPDGRLEHQVEAAAEGIARLLAQRRPRLLLVPSPLEVTADHRAAFAALHRALSPLREAAGASTPEETALLAATAELEVLAYEVNRPLFPNLLVDVSAEIPKLEAAMACYASQQRRHDYLRARLGLSRYRTLTLPAGVEAAEAYVRLAPADFVTRSHAQLVAHLGGEPRRLEVREGPRISVVVRTKDRPALLAEALASLAAGFYRRAEVVLVNDGGRPPEVPADFPLPVLRIDLPQNLGRAAAAQAGVEAATGDYVAFLDDDDIAAPEHLATLAGLVSTAGLRVAYTDAAVGVYELDAREGWRLAERRLPYSRDFDPDLLAVDNYIPFNTVLVERALFAEVGPFDESLPFFEDWDYLIRLAARAPFHHLRQVTCEYRHFRGAGHHVLGETPKNRADFLAMKEQVLAKHATHLTPARLAAVVDRLRAEIVDLAEARGTARREARERAAAVARLEAQRGEAEDRFHRLHGELVSVQGDHARLLSEIEGHAGEIRRLHGEERRLNDDNQRLERDLTVQTDLVARLYAELERLTKRIEAMESTRAWRAHQWWQRRVR